MGQGALHQTADLYTDAIRSIQPQHRDAAVEYLNRPPDLIGVMPDLRRILRWRLWVRVVWWCLRGRFRRAVAMTDRPKSRLYFRNRNSEFNWQAEGGESPCPMRLVNLLTFAR